MKTKLIKFVTLIIIAILAIGATPFVAAHAADLAKLKIASVNDVGEVAESVSFTVTAPGELDFVLSNGTAANDLPIKGLAVGSFKAYTQKAPAGSSSGDIALGATDAMFAAGDQVILKSASGAIIDFYTIPANAGPAKDCDDPSGGSVVTYKTGNHVIYLGNTLYCQQDGTWGPNAPTVTTTGGNPGDNPVVPTFGPDWLNNIAADDNAAAIEAFNQRWAVASGAKGEQKTAGCQDIPLLSGVIGSNSRGTEKPAFKMLTTNMWVTLTGGKFCSSEGFRWLQLDTPHFSSAADTVSFIRSIESELASKGVAESARSTTVILILNLAWSNYSDAQKWGTSVPQGQPDVCVSLPPESVVWGSISAGTVGNTLVSPLINTFANGGVFCSKEGGRAIWPSTN